MEDIISSCDQDSDVQHFITQTLLYPSIQNDFQYVEGILKYQGRIVIGRSNDIRRKILETIHASAIGGHSGVHSCYQRARA